MLVVIAAQSRGHRRAADREAMASLPPVAPVTATSASAGIILVPAWLRPVGEARYGRAETTYPITRWPAPPPPLILGS